MPKPVTYVRVRDASTGHEFDVPDTHPLIATGALKPVKGDRFPPSPVARRPKHHIKLAGRTASREPEPASAVPEEATPEENPS